MEQLNHHKMFQNGYHFQDLNIILKEMELWLEFINFHMYLFVVQNIYVRNFVIDSMDLYNSIILNFLVKI